MKIALTDIETTGLDPLKHEIIEIGLIVFDNKTLEIHGRFNFKIKPENIAGADPKALEVNGYNKEEWEEDGMTIFQALNFYAEATKGCTFMAHNASFDWSFLSVAFTRDNIKPEMNYHRIDTLSIAWGMLPHNKVFSWSLKTLCSYLGVPTEAKVHRALNGAEAAYGIYKKLMEMK